MPEPKKNNNWIPAAVAILSGLAMQMFFFSPGLIFVAAVAIALLQFFAARQFCLAAAGSERWYRLIILPLVFSAGLIMFVTMLFSRFLVQFLFAVNVAFLYLYWRNIFRHEASSSRWRRTAMLNISAYGNFTAYYFLASAIYGLQVFISADTWVLMLIMLAATLLMAYQSAWANGIASTAAWPYILILSVVLLQISWSTSFLTLSYYILGLIAAISYYIAMGLTRLHLLGSLNKKTVGIYLASGFGSILAVLLTSNWISHN